jgi:hypothetical protein
MSLPLLQVINVQLGDLVAPEPTRKQEREERSVTLALEPLPVRSLPERGPLFGRQPVAQPDAQFLYAFDTPDSSHQIGAEEAAVRSLIRQTANCPHPQVDRARREMPGLKMHPIANDNSLVEGESWLGAVPIHEFVDGVAIPPLRVWARQTAENRGLRDFKVWLTEGPIWLPVF